MLLTIISLPLIGSLSLLFTSEKRKEIGLITSIITFILSLFIWILFDNNIYLFQFNTFISGVEIGIDGISLYLILLTTLLTVLILLNGPFDIYFLFWLLVLESILIGVFCVQDILYFYILFELVLIPLYFIMRRSIEIYPYRKNKIERAIKKLLGYTLFGSFLMLLGIILLFTFIGNTNYTYLLSISNIYDDSKILKIIWLCFFIAFAVKVPIMPLHVWLPEAHSEAPTGGSMILAGVLLKLGAYGIIRYLIILWPKTTIYYRPIVEVILVISIIYSTLTILRQVEIKKFIAYSSISHMNLAILGLFSGEFDSITGGYIILINHGIVSAGLFYCAGVLFNRYKLRAIKYYRGLIVTMPIFSILFFLLNLSNIGFPPFGSFISEVLIFLGCFKYSISVSFFASLSIILSGSYGIWFVTRIIYGKARNKFTNDINRKEFFILMVLISISLFIGIVPSIIIDGIMLSI